MLQDLGLRKSSHKKQELDAIHSWTFQYISNVLKHMKYSSETNMNSTQHTCSISDRTFFHIPSKWMLFLLSSLYNHNQPDISHLTAVSKF
jgi:hypothetical protein